MNRRAYISKWAHKEGVFLTPQGKYIARVRNKKKGSNNYTTISSHDTEQAAQKAYNDFYNLPK